MASRFTWVFDPGHGGISPGGLYLTPGKRSPEVPPGIYEGEFNRDMARRLQAHCEGAGIDSTIISPGPINVRNLDRANFSNQLHRHRKNCVYLSIHANASGNGKEWNQAKGFVVFHYPGSKPGQDMARIFHHHLAQGPISSRGIKTARFTVLAKTSHPAILVEYGFMTNMEDTAVLASQAGRVELAHHTFQAIQLAENVGF